jgi:hypothetical protein
MSSDGFDISQLDKIMQKMLSVANDEMPKDSKKFLKTEANKLRKTDIKVFKSKGIESKTGNLLKGFKSGKVYKYNGNLSVRAYNSSPHAHLLDQGWMYTPHEGQNGNEHFIPGFHFFQDAEDEFQPVYFEDAESLVYTVIKKLLED